jgi:hypothetical protein
MTTLESVPLEEVLRDVLDGVKVADGLQLEDLTHRHMALVMIRVQQMRRAKVKEFEELTEAMGKAKADATVAHAKAFLASEGTPTERTQHGKLAAAEAEFAVDVAAGAVKACWKSMEVLRDDWDTCRSIGANQRADKNAIEGWGS